MSSLTDRIRWLARKVAGPGEIAEYHHRLDGMATKHHDGYRQEPVFARAYARAVKAAGWDYGIPWRIHQALWCSEQARKVPGDFVELGTGRGFIMSAVLEGFPEWGESGRSMYLFDTFESGTVGADQKREAASPFYAESFEAVQRNFAEWPRVSLLKGDVFQTLPAQPLGQIALLHVDLNHHEPEVFSLRHLWERVPRGGVVLLDDYAFRKREKQFVAINELGRELGFSVLSTPTGQGIVVK